MLPRELEGKQSLRLGKNFNVWTMESTDLEPLTFHNPTHSEVLESLQLIPRLQQQLQLSRGHSNDQGGGNHFSLEDFPVFPVGKNAKA